MNVPEITAAQSNAFVERFDLAATGSGPLDDLCFAVKDTIDVAGWTSGCGNPDWRQSHPVANVHAICVEQLLRAGARCNGKTHCDELAFGLLGENHFYGTPLNPAAPDRVPGGSSSGSASAVACGLTDVALSTDTGGSVRIPASNCGIFGLRPSHGLISVAGVNPLAPAFDTVGLHARSLEVLARVANVLLANASTSPLPFDTIYLLQDAFDLADAQLQAALAEPLQSLRERLGHRVRQVSLRDICNGAAEAGLSAWSETFNVLQWAEIQSCLGPWLTDVEPALGPGTKASLELTKQLDRRRIAKAVAQRAKYGQHVHHFLGPQDLLCLPTAPAPAPLKGDAPTREGGPEGYYPRTLALTSVAGLARLPEVSLPVARCQGTPVGLSVLARPGQDAFLLASVADLV
jgi:amidase